MKNNKKCAAFILLVCAIVPFFFNVKKVQATYTYSSGSDVVMDKITKNNAGDAIKIFKSPTNVRAVTDFLHYGLTLTAKGFVDKDDSCSVPVPNTIMSGTSDKSPTLSCYDFWYGNKNWGALIKGEKSNSDPSVSDVVTYLKQLGYTQAVSTSLGGEKCFKVKWEDRMATSASGSGGSFESRSICAEIDDAGYMWGSDLAYGDESQSKSPTHQYELQIDTSGGAFGSEKSWEVKLVAGSYADAQFSVKVQEGDNHKKWSEFKSEFESKIDEHNRSASGVTKSMTLSVESTGTGEVSSQVTPDTVFKRTANQQVVTYSGGNLLSEAEVYNIYLKYLTNESKVKLSCGLSDDEYDREGESWMKVQIKRNGKIDDTCYVMERSKELYTGGQYLSGSYDPATNTTSSGSYLFTKRNMSLADIVKAVNKMDLENLEIDDFTGVTESTSDGEGEVEQTCMNSGGAGSLGWIVCSVLDWMGDATEGLYNNIVEPALVVNASFFDQDATREAWEKFRDIANIIFIIVVLAVIFSQLTGYGIDNYGIKKILPKLIVVAILVNLSFLICVLCVDLSNILGNGLQAFLDGLATGADTISISGGPSWGDSGSVNIAADAGIVSVAVIAAAVGVYAVYSNPAILLTLLIGALGVLIAVLFVFIMLAGRKAAVVLLTVLSPVAFILYLLPNTKKIYDKWLKLWEAMLFLYPICGLLIGGGNFASKLMLNVGKDGGVATVLTALVIGIIPIFFVPTLLKSAFAAMGNIGSTISGFGNRMRSGATRGLKNSGAYKELQERGKESGIRRKAGYDKNGNRKWGENGPNWRQRFLRGGNRNIQRNAMAYQKLQSEKGALAATEGANYMLATETANEAKRIASSGEINTIGSIGSGGLTDGLYRALMSGDRAKINAYSDALSAKGENGRKAVKDAYNRAVADGVNDVAAKTLADNIMANHAADYKNNNRSMFNVAQGINSGEKDAVMSTSSYVDAHQSELANKVTAATIGTMDEDAFDETFGIRDANGEIKYGVPTGADAATIGEIAYKAMSTQNAGIKSDRMAKLKGVMEASGYSGPGVQDVNVTNMPKTVAVPGAAEEGKTFDVRAMSDETLLDMATNPNVANDDPTRTAAEQEYLRRNNGKV